MSRGRLFFTVTTILLLLGTGAFWILSNENIIQNSWSLPLGSGYEKNWEEHSRANVVERTVNGRSLVAAVLPDLKPGTYQKKWGEEITVLPRQVTEIDLRGQSEKAKTPADIAAGEAQESFIKQIYDRLTEG